MSTTEALPEFPKAAAYIDQSGECSPSINCHVYTADQMRDYARAALAAAAPSQNPFGHFVYIAAEQRGEFVHDLDEAIDDLTNCECEVTDLYERPAPAAAAPEGWKLVPIEPTREMMEAMPRMPALRAELLPFCNAGWSLNAITNRERWAAALASAPTAQSQPVTEFMRAALNVEHSLLHDGPGDVVIALRERLLPVLAGVLEECGYLPDLQRAAQPQPPKGWKLVPEEITMAMDAATTACETAGEAWTAMLAAAPPSPTVLFDSRPQNQRIAEAPTLLNGLTEQETAASASLAGISGARLRHDHDWRPRELQEKHGEVTLPLAEFKRLVAAQPERYCSALDPAMQAINASAARMADGVEKLRTDDTSDLDPELLALAEQVTAAQPEAPAEPSDAQIERALDAVICAGETARWYIEQAFTADDPTTRQLMVQEIGRAMLASATPAPVAAAEPSTKPLGYVKFRAAQTLQTDGYCDGHEWLEFCEPGEVGDDKKPAFPVYASPQAATVAQQPAELTDEVAWLLESGADTALYWTGALWTADAHLGGVCLGPVTTKDANAAVRFTTKEAAEAALKSFSADYRIRVGGPGFFRVTEHMWPAIKAQGGSR